MPTHRHQLPQLNDTLFLTDGGLETYMIFHEGIELPHFSALTLLDNPAATEKLKSYYRKYLDIAADTGTGFILDSVTWRASRDWGQRLGLGPESLQQANKHAIALIDGLRTEYEARIPEIVLSGVIGPRGDGYDAGEVMTVEAAETYHREQINMFSATEADMISAITMTNVPEAIGIALAARQAGLPSVLSFTTETDGRLPTGQPLGEAIEEVDQATDNAPAYYMVNCAHPRHFVGALRDGATWTKRLRGLRTNASKLSHAELDEAEILDEGDPAELGRDNAQLQKLIPSLTIFGGCCGTDHRHVREICRQVTR